MLNFIVSWFKSIQEQKLAQVKRVELRRKLLEEAGIV